jgi:hypothetical protein
LSANKKPNYYCGIGEKELTCPHCPWTTQGLVDRSKKRVHDLHVKKFFHKQQTVSGTALCIPFDGKGTQHGRFEETFEPRSMRYSSKWLPAHRDGCGRPRVREEETCGELPAAFFGTEGGGTWGASECEEEEIGEKDEDALLVLPEEEENATCSREGRLPFEQISC